MFRHIKRVVFSLLKLKNIYSPVLHLMSPAHYQISHSFIAHRVGSDNELVTS
jgi:hypothetical protein